MQLNIASQVNVTVHVREPTEGLELVNSVYVVTCHSVSTD